MAKPIEEIPDVNRVIDYSQALSESARLKYFGHLNRLGNTGIRAANLQSRLVLPGTAIQQLLDRVVVDGRRAGIDLTTEIASLSDGQTALYESRVQILEIPEGSPQVLRFPEGTAAGLTPLQGSLDVFATGYELPIQVGRGDSVYVGPEEPSIQLTSDFRTTTALLVGGRQLEA